MFYFGGVNIFPSAIENFIRRVPEFSTEYQLLVPAQGSGKRLRIRVEKAAESIPDERMQTAIKGFTRDIVYHIKVTPEVEVAAPGSLQRFEGKARRLIRET
jgi:phenylacetate-CoA ligase